MVSLYKALTGTGVKIERDELSYKKLQKMVETFHPTNPETREKFSIFDEVTVYNFGLKLTDACGIIKLVLCFKKCKSICKKLFAT